MARRRTARTNAPRQRRNGSQLIRQMARTMAFVPHRVAIPADPPPLTRTYVHNTTFPLQLVLADKGGFIPGDTSNDKNSRIGFKLETDLRITQVELTVKDLFKAWQIWMRAKYDSVNHMEICLIKACYWGPSPNSISGLEIGLEVGYNAPFSNLAMRDSGGTASRARIGITAPFRNWLISSSPSVCLTIDPDSSDVLAALVPTSSLVSGFLLGTLHATVSVRRSEA